MTEAKNSSMPGQMAARWLIGILVIGLLWLLLVGLVPQLRPLLVPSLYALIPAAVVVLALSIQFAAQGRDAAPVFWLLAGWLVLLSGSAADIAATLLHTPDLELEANPLINTIRSSGHSLEVVFVYGAAVQVLMIGTGLTLWLALLKHRTSLGRLMPPQGSLLSYFKAGTGGRELSYRQWLCPLRWQELPWGYHLTCWTGVVFTFLGLVRFYAAAEWFRLVIPSVPNRIFAGSLFTFLLCTGYALWLKHVRQSLPEATEAPEPSEPAANPIVE